MVAVSNALEGTSGTTITNANTGGPNQFNAVTLTGTGSTATFDTAHVKAGTTALKHHLATVASTAYEDWNSTSLGTALANGYMRFYVYMTAYPSVTTRLAAYVGAAALRGSLQVTTTGTIRTVNSAGSVVATTTAAIPLNAWTRIEFEITGISGTTGTIAARMFSGANLETNTPDTGGSLSNAAQTVAGTIDDCRLGQSASVTMTTAWDIWYDDPAFSSVSQPGSSVTTTTVGASRATTWTTRTATAASRATTWTANGTTSASRATTWTTAASVPATRATTWNVAGTTTTVGASRGTTWNTAASTAASRATTWTTGASVPSTRATTWTTATTSAATRATTWNAYATTGDQRSTLWAVASNAGTGQVGTPTILNGPDTTITRPYTSPSISPAANALVMVVVSNTGSASDTSPKNATDLTSTFGIVGSWAIVQQAANAATSTSTHVWYAVTSSSPGSGTVTLNTGASPSASIITIIQLTNPNVSSPVVGFVGATFTTATLTQTLTQAPAVTDMALTFTTSRNDSTGATLGSTMTALLVNQTNANPSAAQSVQYRTGSTSTTVDVAGLNTINNTSLGVVVVGAATGLSSVGASRGTTWRAMAQATGTAASSYRVTAQVTGTAPSAWRALAQVTGTKPGAWNVLSATSASRATSWTTAAATSATRATTWNVAGTTTTVGASRGTTWTTRAAVAPSRATTWNVAAPFVNVAVVADMQPGAGANPPPTVVASRVVAWNPSHIIMPGDLANDGTTAQYGYFDTMYGSLKARIHPVPGNHDWGNTAGNSLTAYNTYWGAQDDAGASPRMYSFDIVVGSKTWHVIGIDSDNATNASAVTSNAVPSSGSTLYNAVASDLAANTGKNIIAFHHHPRWSDGTATGAGGTNDDTTMTDLWNLLYDNHADLVLVGHCHSYQRFPKFGKTGTADAAGIREIVVGTGGSGLHTLQASGRRSTTSSYQSAAYDQLNSQWFGYLRLTLFEQSYSWDFISQDGTTSLDSGSQATNLNASTVTAQRDTTWTAKAQTTGTSPAAWRVTQQVTATAASSYAVLAAVAASRGTTWRAVARTSSTTASSWTIKAQVTSSATSGWNVAQTAVSARSTTWAAKAQVTSTAPSAWNVASALTTVAASRASTWTTKAQISASSPSAYRVLAQSTATRASAWTVNAALTANRATTWTVKATVTGSVNAAWNVLSVGTVAASRGTTWATKAATTGTTNSAWTVKATVTASASTSWAVLSAVAPVTRATTWRALAAATGTKGSAWNTKAQVSATVPSQWDVLARLTSTSPSAWSILTTVPVASRNTTWRVKATTSATVNTAWNIAQVLDQPMRVYDVIGPYAGFADVTGPATGYASATMVERTLTATGPHTE